MALTVHQAEKEAGWRWGGLFARGFARHSREKQFEVGVKRFGRVEVRGKGNSWESAFANADIQTNGPVSRRKALASQGRKTPVRG